jgi:hypothetical protein
MSSGIAEQPEQTSSTDWERHFQAGRVPWERAEPNPAFLAWRAGGVLTPGRVLVPCAGRSPEPRLLAEAGFELVVVDLAPSAIDAQTSLLAGLPAQLVCADLYAWEPEGRFDYIYDQTCLCALPPASLPAYEERLATWLAPGGTLLMLFMQTGKPGGPPFDCPIDQMRGLFGAYRWDWPDRLEVPIQHPGGTYEQPVVLRRRW